MRNPFICLRRTAKASTRSFSRPKDINRNIRWRLRICPEGANKRSNDYYSLYIGRVFIGENEKPVTVKSNRWVVTNNGKDNFFLSVERVACRRQITLRCLVTLDGTNWFHSHSSFHLLYLLCWWPSCRHRHVESLVFKIKWCSVSTQWMTQVYAQLVGDFKDLQSVAEDQPALDLSVIHFPVCTDETHNEQWTNDKIL